MGRCCSDSEMAHGKTLACLVLCWLLVCCLTRGLPSCCCHAPCNTRSTSCLGKGRTCISDNLSAKRLDELARFIDRCTIRKDVPGNPPRADEGAETWRPCKSPEKLVKEFCEKNTTPEKVFGAPLGEMPPARDLQTRTTRYVL